MSRDGPVFVSHFFHLIFDSSFKAADMYAWRLFKVLDDLHNQLNLLAERSVLFVVHVSFIYHINHKNLAMPHCLANFLLQFFLMLIDSSYICLCLFLAHGIRNLMHFILLCLPLFPLFVFFNVGVLDIVGKPQNPFLSLISLRFVVLRQLFLAKCKLFDSFLKDHRQFIFKMVLFGLLVHQS